MTVTVDHGVERERLLAIAMDENERQIDHLHPAAVVWDLDSTVADTLHRHHMLDGIKAWYAAVETWGDEEQAVLAGNVKVTWDDYSMACIRDTPVAGTVTLMRMLWKSSLQIAVSGRNAVANELTQKWVRLHKVPLDKIVLRVAGDFTHSDEYKVRELSALEEAGITVLAYIDDWPSTATAVTLATGIPSLMVNPNYKCIACHSRERSCPCGQARLGNGGT
jgi:hypothetical protein